MKSQQVMIFAGVVLAVVCSVALTSNADDKEDPQQRIKKLEAIVKRQSIELSVNRLLELHKGPKVADSNAITMIERLRKEGKTVFQIADQLLDAYVVCKKICTFAKICAKCTKYIAKLG